jgi:hypothetical protein
VGSDFELAYLECGKWHDFDPSASAHTNVWTSLAFSSSSFVWRPSFLLCAAS